VIASDAYDLDTVRKMQAKGIVMKVEDGVKPEELVASLKTLCEKYKGNRTAYVLIENPSLTGVRRYKLPDELRVSGDESFIAEFELRFGKNRVLFCR
jgi:hypothetical protein